MTSEYISWFDWPKEWQYESDDPVQREEDEKSELDEQTYFKFHKHPRKFIVKKNSSQTK